MYAGFITSRHAINWLGAHQKFNKVAHRILLPKIHHTAFPSLNDILHFEGPNGPDGLKFKSAGKDEPSYFYDPIHDEGELVHLISEHFEALVEQLKKKDMTRSAFEASWLAHAVVDGLTPAHHYPYEDVVRQYGGQPRVIRSARDKVIYRGANRRDTIAKTLKMWSSKGMLASHVQFEAGVSSSVITAKFDMSLDEGLLTTARSLGQTRFFKEQARMLSKLGLFEGFSRGGWNISRVQAVRRILAPTIIQTVAIIWLLAYEQAGFKVHH